MSLKIFYTYMEYAICTYFYILFYIIYIVYIQKHPYRVQLKKLENVAQTFYTNFIIIHKDNKIKIQCNIDFREIYTQLHYIMLNHIIEYKRHYKYGTARLIHFRNVSLWFDFKKKKLTRITNVYIRLHTF